MSTIFGKYFIINESFIIKRKKRVVHPLFLYCSLHQLFVNIQHIVAVERDEVICHQASLRREYAVCECDDIRVGHAIFMKRLLRQDAVQQIFKLCINILDIAPEQIGKISIQLSDIPLW
mgnify:CR=1 FL=1